MRIGRGLRIVALLPCLGIASECQLSESGLGPTPDVVVDIASGDVSPLPDAGADAPLDGPFEAESGPISAPPNSLAGLQLWLRSDLVGLDDAGYVSSWPDQSGLNDPTRTASAPSGLRPTLDSDAAFGGHAAVSFHNSEFLQTMAWADASVSAPLTLFIVGGQDTPATAGRYFFDSINAGQQSAVVETTGLRVYAGGVFSSAAGTTVGARAIIVTINAGTAIRNSADTPQVAGPIPSTATFNGVTVGSYAGLGPYALNGDIAEVAVWNRALLPTEIHGLNLYAFYRYGITISP